MGCKEAARGTWLALFLAIGAALPADAGPEGQVTWAVHVTLVPAWFDPGEAPIGTAFMVLYALHDALVNPIVWSPAKSR